MSLTDDALKSKFSTLNETQDSIVSVANWMIFHRRHAERVAQAWYTRLRDVGSPKRLNLVYLANEVVQQSKLRSKSEFPDAFAPIIADAVQLAYKGAPTDVQQKLRRVVEVWRSRNVFEKPIVDAIEARLDETDKSKGLGKKPLMGGSLFSSGKDGIPKELEHLVPLQTAVSRESLSVGTSKPNADAEYDKLNDPNAVLPSPPVHAARLSSLMKALANAESSLSESIKARKELIAGLEKLLDANKSDLSKEESQRSELSSRKIATEEKKREVEDSIVKGMSGSNNNTPSTPTGLDHNPGISNGHSESNDLDRPEYEALTPPPVEALTPPPIQEDVSYYNQVPEQAITESTIPEHADVSNLLAAMAGGPPAPTAETPHQPSLVRPRSSGSGVNGSGGTINAKKRKVSHDEEIAGLEMHGDAMEGLDDDVAEMLRQGN